MDQAEMKQRADAALDSIDRSFRAHDGEMETRPGDSAAQILAGIRDPKDWLAVRQMMMDQNSASSKVLIEKGILGPMECVVAKPGPGHEGPIVRTVQTLCSGATAAIKDKK
jgi:hypothetical protein